VADATRDGRLDSARRRLGTSRERSGAFRAVAERRGTRASDAPSDVVRFPSDVGSFFFSLFPSPERAANAPRRRRSPDARALTLMPPALTRQNENVQLRLNSIRRLTTIASALGPERTRAELVPFLADANDDEDECLLAVAEEMVNLIGLVGGPEHAHALLAPLENLASVEETAVRDKAVRSACEVARGMTPEGAKAHFAPLAMRLASGDWFSARVSACGLMATAYELCAGDEAARDEMRAAYAKLCGDETPLVRRAAAQHLGAFAAACESRHVETEMLSLFRRLTLDEQDSVRLLVVEDCAALGRLLPKEACAAEMVPAAKKFVADKSWRVRYAVAKQLYDLCECVGAQVARDELVSSYERLLADGEAEVRIASAGLASELCRLVGPEAATAEIVPRVKELAGDASQHVRAALASVVMGLAPTLGKDRTIEHLLPVFLTLLKDEIPEVRLNIISKLEEVNSVIGVDLLAQELLPAIEDLAEDAHWRVRLAIIEYVPLLASQMGTAFLFQKNAEGEDGELTKLCLRWLGDRVYSIREAAAVNLKRLAEVFGPEWAKEHVIPRVMALAENPHYLHRSAVVRAMTLLASAAGQDTCLRDIMPALKAAAKDAVPNVRFGAAKALGEVASTLDAAVVEGEIRPTLAELEADEDADVRFYAGQSLQLCEIAARG
jgi:serine/threonine-protein phosphatase 2A regulatory subunit A